MPSDEQPAQHCELQADADLLATLDTQCLEHLDVDDYRTFVLYRDAVLDLRVTEGTLPAAQSVTVASQGFAWHVSEPDPAV